MALPSSGTITARMINVELGREETAPFSITGSEERELAGKPTGTISFSDFYGKSNGRPIDTTTFTFAATSGLGTIVGTIVTPQPDGELIVTVVKYQGGSGGGTNQYGYGTKWTQLSSPSDNTEYRVRTTSPTVGEWSSWNNCGSSVNANSTNTLTSSGTMVMEFRRGTTTVGSKTITLTG